MKRKLVLLLTAAMVTMSVVGCGSEKQEPAAEPAQEEAAEETEAPAEETEAPAEEGEEASIDLKILYEQDDSMINTYSLLAVNPEAPFADADGNAVADVQINQEGASALINWMLSEEGEQAAANYG